MISRNKRHLKLIKEISKELGVDARVVHFVVSHPQLFLVNVMRDKDDYRAVRFPFWGVYTLKDNKTKK